MFLLHFYSFEKQKVSLNGILTELWVHYIKNLTTLSFPHVALSNHMPCGCLKYTPYSSSCLSKSSLFEFCVNGSLHRLTLYYFMKTTRYCCYTLPLCRLDFSNDSDEWPELKADPFGSRGLSLWIGGGRGLNPERGFPWGSSQWGGGRDAGEE